MWWAIAQYAMKAYADNEANDKAKFENALIDLRKGAKAKVRLAANGKAMAEDALGRWVQSVNNKAALNAGGAALNANSVNSARQQEGVAAHVFSTNLQEIEQEGQRAAATSASGVSGNVVGMIAGSMALRSSIVRENIRRASMAEATDSAMQAGMIYSQMINGTDNTILNPGLDYNIDTPSHNDVKNGFALFAPAAAGIVQSTYSGVEQPRQVADPTPTTTDPFKFSNQAQGDSFFNLDYSSSNQSNQFGRKDPWRY